MDLVEQVYRMTAGLPSDERFCLGAQMRRAAVSIASNIAAGHGRLSIACGSLLEVETQLRIAARPGLADPAQTEPLLVSCDDLGRMLFALQGSIDTTADGQRPTADEG